MKKSAWIIVILALNSAIAAQEGYPPGTLVPSVELDIMLIRAMMPIHACV